MPARLRCECNGLKGEGGVYLNKRRFRDLKLQFSPFSSVGRRGWRGDGREGETKRRKRERRGVVGVGEWTPVSIRVATQARVSQRLVGMSSRDAGPEPPTRRTAVETISITAATVGKIASS